MIIVMVFVKFIHSYPDMFENLWKDYQNKIAVQKFPLPKKK